MTNYERIKAMSLAEMADFIGYFNPEEDICSKSNQKIGSDYCRTHSCSECAKKYLEEDGEQNGKP